MQSVIPYYSTHMTNYIIVKLMLRFSLAIPPLLFLSLPTMTSAAPTATAKVHIVYYSMYGHIAKMVDAARKGLEASGVEVKVFQVPETLPKEVREKMHVPPQDDKIPFATHDDLVNCDGLFLGFPTRYGSPAGQFKSFWDSTGSLWQKGALHGKPFTIVTSTATQGGGQESTILSSLGNFVHHGMVFVPPGYSCPQVEFDLSEVHGGGPFGAGTYAGPKGDRQPSAKELEFAETQGKVFGTFAAQLAKGRRT